MNDVYVVNEAAKRRGKARKEVKRIRKSVNGDGMRILKRLGKKATL